MFHKILSFHSSAMSPKSYGSVEDSPKPHPIHRHSSLLDSPKSPEASALQFASPLLRRFSERSLGDVYLNTSQSHGTPQTPLLKGNGTEQTAQAVAEEGGGNESFIYYIVYALVNSIMCVPCLYGYASVIFSHPVYQSHINALSKLVILSSVVHQFCFSIFSSLPFR